MIVVAVVLSPKIMKGKFCTMLFVTFFNRKPGLEAVVGECIWWETIGGMERRVRVYRSKWWEADKGKLGGKRCCEILIYSTRLGCDLVRRGRNASPSCGV